jgi:hypothetical protein
MTERTGELGRPGGMDILTNYDESGMNYLGDSPGPKGYAAFRIFIQHHNM